MAGDSARANPRKSNPERRMSLGAHLIELRKRLTRAAFAVLGGTIIGWMIYDLGWLGDLLDPVMPGAAELLEGQGTWAALSGPVFTIADQLGVDSEKITLNFGTLTGALDIQFQISLVVGIILSSPVWLYQIFAFFVPGLTAKEKRYTFGFFFSAVPLFLLGCAAGWMVLPRIVEFMFRFVPPGASQLYDTKTYVDFILKLLLATGVAFVMPVFLVLLNFASVLQGKTILKGWRWAVLIIIVFTAMATPAADPISMLLLALPMVLLYFLAVGVALWHDRAVARRRAAFETSLTSA
jgi:sec-independent protein translocase protein TatC